MEVIRIDRADDQLESFLRLGLTSTGRFWSLSDLKLIWGEHPQLHRHYCKKENSIELNRQTGRQTDRQAIWCQQSPLWLSRDDSSCCCYGQPTSPWQPTGFLWHVCPAHVPCLVQSHVDVWGVCLQARSGCVGRGGRSWSPCERLQRWSLRSANISSETGAGTAPPHLGGSTCLGESWTKERVKQLLFMLSHRQRWQWQWPGAAAGVNWRGVAVTERSGGSVLKVSSGQAALIICPTALHSRKPSWTSRKERKGCLQDGH